MTFLHSYLQYAVYYFRNDPVPPFLIPGAHNNRLFITLTQVKIDALPTSMP